MTKTTDFNISSITGASKSTGMRLVSSEAEFSVVFVDEISNSMHSVSFVQQCLNVKVGDVD